MSVLTVRLLVGLAALLLGGAQQPRDPLPASTLPLRLVGVFVDAETPERSAALIQCIDPDARPQRVQAGQRACDLAEVREIHAEGVVIRNLFANRVERLGFVDSPPSAGPPPPPPPTVRAASPDLVAVGMPQGAVNYYLGNLADVLQSALATPHYRETGSGQRTMDGFEISQVKPGGLVQQLGLQNGDVLANVNGQALDGLPAVLRLAGGLQNTPQVNLTVLRANRKLTFVIKAK